MRETERVVWLAAVRFGDAKFSGSRREPNRSEEWEMSEEVADRTYKTVEQFVVCLVWRRLSSLWNDTSSDIDLLL